MKKQDSEEQKENKSIIEEDCKDSYELSDTPITFIKRTVNLFKYFKPEYFPWWVKLIVAIGLSFLIAGIFYWGMYTGFNYGYNEGVAHVFANYKCTAIGTLNFSLPLPG
jgi:hypothetical protein